MFTIKSAKGNKNFETPEEAADWLAELQPCWAEVWREGADEGVDVMNHDFDREDLVEGIDAIEAALQQKDATPKITQLNGKAFDAFTGATIVEVTTDAPDTDESIRPLLAFHATDGRVLVFGHWQDCCESVQLSNWDEADGAFLEGATFRGAEVRTTRRVTEWGDSMTSTFYEVATSKGSLTLSFQGSSNGYYSESVDVVLLEPVS
jgi:hypothetical protein